MKRIALLVLLAATVIGCNRESFEERDIIEDIQGEITNGERLYAFYENTVNGKEDAVRIISYTTEGDPIYQDLHFDGNKIESVEDYREDQFGSKEVVTRMCNEITIISSETEAVYVLAGCDPETGMNSVLHEK